MQIQFSPAVPPLIVCLAILGGTFGADAQTAGDQFNVKTGPTSAISSCEDKYAQTMEALYDERTQSNAKRAKDVIDCKNDDGCVQAARKNYATREREINKKGVDAGAQRDICERRAQLGAGGATGAPGRQQSGPSSSAQNPQRAARATPAPAPQPRPPVPRLPPGAVATGDPDALDTGARGYLGSFPGTKSECGSFCYTYLWETNIYNVNPGPTNNPNSVGHATPQPGDAAVVYQKITGTQTYQPVHFAVFMGNDTFYQRNGASSIEVVNSQFFSNFSNAIVRYVNRTTGK